MRWSFNKPRWCVINMPPIAAVITSERCGEVTKTRMCHCGWWLALHKAWRTFAVLRIASDVLSRLAKSTAQQAAVQVSHCWRVLEQGTGFLRGRDLVTQKWWASPFLRGIRRNLSRSEIPSGGGEQKKKKGRINKIILGAFLLHMQLGKDTGHWADTPYSKTTHPPSFSPHPNPLHVWIHDVLSAALSPLILLLHPDTAH